jgi:acetyl esterase/lipase
MALPPEVREHLSRDQELGSRLVGLGIVEQREAIRTTLEEWARSTAHEVAEVARIDDHTVPVDGGAIRLRVHTPFADGPLPAFFHIHGGGFTLGAVDWIFNEAKCAHLCRETRCVVATVDYRLAPEQPFPTAPEDCYRALLWLVDHAAELDVDPSRIVVGGESAGGNLAAVVALMSRDRGGPQPVLQLLEVPVADMSDRSGEHRSRAVYGTGYGLERAGIEAFQDDYLPRAIDRDDPYVSPYRSPDLAGLPPAHVITAEFDPLRDEGEAYARRLVEAGVKTTVHRYLGHTHGSSSLWQTWTSAAAWMDEVAAAIRSAVRAEVGVA